MQLRLRAASPFFATLLLYARLLPTRTVEVAATDGADIFFNPEGIMRYPVAEQLGVLLHEVLHAALHHVPRRGPRHPFVWNVAADVVVNGIVRAAGFALPADALLDGPLETLTVEEVYSLLWQRLHPPAAAPKGPAGAGSPASQGNGSNNGGGTATPKTQPDTLTDKWLRRAYHDWDAARYWVLADLLAGRPADAPRPAGPGSRSATEAYWRAALHRATAVRSLVAGPDPLGHGREAAWALGPRLSWRTLLWRYLVQTPVDFGGFDRRFVGRGLYLETLAGETVRVAVCLDTSGSVDSRLLGELLAEVRGILGSYPHLEVQFWYADAALYGPHELTAADAAALPRPQGGGDTSFEPFFTEMARQQPAPNVLVYLTDGYGDFPAEAPAEAPAGPVLWVVAPGGAADATFPFGEVLRLV
ncbi:VWA-like domain-containing protein [Hymenobacter arcticus]